MTLSVLGINHKTADVGFREQFAFNPEKLAQAYASLSEQQLNNVIILSTCNRTELYFYQHSDESIHNWLSGFTGVGTNKMALHSYSYHQNQALTHMIRVASGLDSMILGEPQILGQLKQAVSVANTHLQLSKKFNWLIEQVFSATKKVRYESKLGEQPITLAFAVTKLAQQIFDDLSANVLMLVAVGDMNQLVAKNLCSTGINKVILTNRTYAKANEFADELKASFDVKVDVIEFDQLHDYLHHADIVCSCTASLHPVIEYSKLKKVIKKRRYKPMLMVDLAVPRDIEEKVSKIDDIYDYTVDDLQQVLFENIQKRKTAAVHAEVVVGNQVADINTKRRLNDVGYFISQYQTQMASMADEVYLKAEQELAKGMDNKEVMQNLTKRLTAKLSHTHFNLIKEAAGLEDTKVLNFLVDKLSK